MDYVVVNALCVERTPWAMATIGACAIIYVVCYFTGLGRSVGERDGV